MCSATLKSQVMPSIVANIKQLSLNAPSIMREEFRTLLTNGGILPNYDADVTTLKEVLRDIDGIVSKTLEIRPEEPEQTEVPLKSSGKKTHRVLDTCNSRTMSRKVCQGSRIQKLGKARHS